MIFKVIIGVVGTVTGILLWMKIIPLPEGWNEIPVGLVGLLAAPIYYFIDFLIKKRKESKSALVHMLLDFEMTTKLTDERLKEEIELRDKTIEALNEVLARKDLPSWKRIVRNHIEKGELKKAIESIDIHTGDEEAAQKHIYKAELYASNFQFDEAEQHYIQAIIIFPSYDNYFEIASFYYDLNKFTEAMECYKHCLNLTNLPEEKANVLNNMGLVQQKNNDYSEAELSYEEALKIRRKLAEENPRAYLPKIAMTLNNLAVLHRNINEYPKAFEEYEEALKIYKKLAKENPKAFLPDLAMTLNNLANLHWNIYEYPKALEEYEEALYIRKKFAKENPKAFLPDVAMTLNNLANLYSAINEYPKALEEYEEALKIRRKLAEENPNAYLSDVARNLLNLANLHRNINEYSKALEEYEEALKIFKQLAEENPKAFLPDVAMTLNNLSMFYQDDIPKEELSLEYAYKALEVLRKCNDTSFVREQLEKSEWIIKEWSNKLIVN